MPLSTKVKIEIDNKEIKDFVNLNISQNMGTHHEFELICRMDLMESSDGFFLDKSKEYLGTEVKFSIESESTKRPGSLFFRGIITEVEANRGYGSFGDGIIFRGASPDILLDDSLHCQSFENMTLQQIVDEVLKDYTKSLFKPQVNPQSKDSALFTVAYKESAFSFLERICAKKGEWFFYDGNQLVVGELPDKEVDLIQGIDLTDFDFTMKVAPLNFKYVAYNYLSAQKYESVASNQDVKDSLNDYGKFAHDKSEDAYIFEGTSLYNNPLKEGSEQQHLDARVKLEKESRALNMAITNGSTDNPNVSLGCKVNIKSVKPDHSGTIDYGQYIVTSINHSCDRSGNYQNGFMASPSSSKRPASTSPHATPVCETQSALVTDVDDPEKMGRIRVQFYWQQNNAYSPWLRIVSPYAGKDKGFYFIPEVGEEVLVAFENDNAEKPYVIGSMYHGKAKPDSWADSDNNIKGIRTRSGHTIEFYDTDGSEEIIIHDKDKVNTITISSHGKELKIQSEGDLKINAQNIDMVAEKDFNLQVKGKIQAKSNGSSSYTAGGDMKIEGSNVTAKASGNFKAEGGGNAEVSAMGSAVVKGTGNAELSAAGNAVVKGAIVMIN